MQLTLGYKTDLFFHGFDGNIRDRGNYIAVELPTNPTFFWGNLLIFDRPPLLEDVSKWPEIFRNEYRHNPEIKHCTLAWVSPRGEQGAAKEFVKQGFELEEGVVLATDRLNEPKYMNREISVRAITHENEWEEMIEAQIATMPDGHSIEHFTRFKRDQVMRYRAMIQQGMGKWFGAYLGGRQVANMGIFVKDGIGRYQQVSTHPDYRRRGICGTLVWTVGQHALKDMNAKTLVMAADENYHAARIYESVGFKPVEKQLGVCKWERGAK